MIALDTNIVVRLLVKDDAEQFDRSVAILAKAAADDEPVRVCSVVIAEAVWVLTGLDGWSRARIADAFDHLTALSQLTIEHGDALRGALARFRTGELGLADAYIAEIGVAAGCRATLTFDRKAARSGLFEAI